jgi:hypothetical protein
MYWPCPSVGGPRLIFQLVLCTWSAIEWARFAQRIGVIVDMEERTATPLVSATGVRARFGRRCHPGPLGRDRHLVSAEGRNRDEAGSQNMSAALPFFLLGLPLVSAAYDLGRVRPEGTFGGFPWKNLTSQSGRVSPRVSRAKGITRSPPPNAIAVRAIGVQRVPMEATAPARPKFTR